MSLPSTNLKFAQTAREHIEAKGYPLREVFRSFNNPVTVERQFGSGTGKSKKTWEVKGQTYGMIVQRDRDSMKAICVFSI